jgi:ABC-type uncharacterized transport system substrate-binding protein
MNKVTLWLVAIFLVGAVEVVDAQQAKTIRRIGFLVNTGTPYQDAFYRRLRELGYVEGQNLIVKTRYAEGNQERLPGLAKELVGLGVELIVAGGPAISAAAKATNKIPIVAGSGVDLIASGHVASLARPGGNVTGTTNIDMDMTAKRLELLQESFPKISRAAVLHGGAKPDLDALATELVRLNLASIVTGGPAATRAAKKATPTIPIVMGFDYDPVASGVITSLARPGGNVTGLSSLAPEISGKQLELLQEVLPGLSRVAVLVDSTEPGIGQLRKEAELVAAGLKVQLQYLNILSPKDIATAFDAATKGRAQAMLALSSFIIISQRTQIAELATKNRLPAIYPWPEFVEDGGLMTYGANSNDLFRRAATYVDKILKGAKPADLPVEQPKKFEFIVNLKAAKRIGLTIPPNVLARADRVIR